LLEYFKNGKPKGASWSREVYYFFDNAKNYEGLKYDKDFLIKNLNKI
jgi:hypothetical protein